MEIFVQVLMAVLFVSSAVVALTFWNQILDWTSNNLLPWIKVNLPWLENYVIDAFIALDKVVVPIRNKIKRLSGIKEAWEMLRKYFLQILVQFEQKTVNEWVKQITSWTIRNLKSKEVVKTVSQQIVPVDSLPAEVRKEWLKRKTTQDINLTDVRDEEIKNLAMTNSL